MRLVIFSGLPGAGKTTLSQALSRTLPSVHLRIDTLEQALRDLCGVGQDTVHRALREYRRRGLVEVVGGVRRGESVGRPYDMWQAVGGR